MKQIKLLTLIILLAVTVLFTTACERATAYLAFIEADQATDQVNQEDLINDQSDVNVDEQEVEVEENKQPQVPEYSVEVPAGFSEEVLDRQQYLKTQELQAVLVEPEITNPDPANELAFEQNKPQLLMVVYELKDSDQLMSKINQIIGEMSLTSVEIGNNTYLQADTSGLVAEQAYYLYQSPYLYEFVLKAYPANLADEELNQKVNDGFLQVLETFKVK